MSRRLCLPAFAVAAFLATPALALESSADASSNYDPGPQQRRSDFAMGGFLGAGTGSVSAYPNDVSKIGVGKYETDTGLGGGLGGGFWLGAALRDWFVFGVGVSGVSVSGHGYTSNGSAFILHVEAFPLFYQGGIWQNVGLFGEFGAGGRQMMKGTQEVGSGGAMSIVTFGAVYEPLRISKKFCAGPLLQFMYQFSDSTTASAVLLGGRIAFYGGPG